MLHQPAGLARGDCIQFHLDLPIELQLCHIEMCTNITLTHGFCQSISQKGKGLVMPVSRSLGDFGG